VAPDLQNRWHRFWAVHIFRCVGTSPEIPDFPETPEKSPEYSGFTDKIVLSGDFHDSPIHPPMRHQDPFRRGRQGGLLVACEASDAALGSHMNVVRG
jgi:hypothetical protein